MPYTEATAAMLTDRTGSSVHVSSARDNDEGDIPRPE